MNKLLEIKYVAMSTPSLEYWHIKDGRKRVALVSRSDARKSEEQFQITMNGCAFYKATASEVVEFVRSTVQDRLNAFGGDSVVIIRGLECFGV